MFHVTEDGGAAWTTGPEFQLEDNVKAADKFAVAGYKPSTNRRLTPRPTSLSMRLSRLANGTTSAW
jgi:hypothetical protein